MLPVRVRHNKQTLTTHGFQGTFAMSSSSRRYEDEADTNAAAETKVPLLSPEGVVIGDMEEGKKMKMADMGKRRRRKKKATFADGDEEEE